MLLLLLMVMVMMVVLDYEGQGESLNESLSESSVQPHQEEKLQSYSLNEIKRQGCPRAWWRNNYLLSHTKEGKREEEGSVGICCSG